MNESPETDYLVRLLRMNPLEQLAEILALRSDFLEPEMDQSHLIVESVSFEDRKELTINNIDALRKELWTMDSQTLRLQIAAIDITGLPDLAVSLSRLQAISDCHDSFQKLEAHPACFPQFFELFCNLVSASPQRIVKLRAEYLDALKRGTTDSHEHNPKEYYRIARIIRGEMPELYEFEKPWLEQIISRQKPNNVVGFLVAGIAIITFLVALCFFVISKYIFN